MLTRQQGSLERVLELLKRFWFVPVAGLIIGVGLSFVSSRGTSATAATSIRLVGQPEVDALGSAFGLDVVDIGPEAREIVLLLESNQTIEPLNLDIDDDQFDLSVTGDDGLNMVVTGGSERETEEITNAYLDAIRDLRSERARTLANSMSAEAEASRARLEELSAVPDVESEATIILEQSNTTLELTRLDALIRTADLLRQYDGGVVAFTDYNSTAWILKAALLGLSLAALGVVGVLTIGPLGARVRTVGDVDRLAEDASFPVFAYSVSGSGEWVLHRLLSRVSSNGDALIAGVGDLKPGTIESLERSTRGTQSKFANLSAMTKETSDVTEAAASVVVIIEQGTVSTRQLEHACRELESAGLTISGIAIATS